MRLGSYILVIQWSSSREEYEGYYPTLFLEAGKFLPGVSRVCYGNSVTAVAGLAEDMGVAILDEFSRIAILPPQPDLGTCGVQEQHDLMYA